MLHSASVNKHKSWPSMLLLLSSVCTQGKMLKSSEKNSLFDFHHLNISKDSSTLLLYSSWVWFHSWHLALINCSNCKQALYSTKSFFESLFALYTWIEPFLLFYPGPQWLPRNIGVYTWNKKRECIDQDGKLLIRPPMFLYAHACTQEGEKRFVMEMRV